VVVGAGGTVVGALRIVVVVLGAAVVGALGAGAAVVDDGLGAVGRVVGDAAARTVLASRRYTGPDRR
jgi:hypothetical protein